MPSILAATSSSKCTWDEMRGMHAKTIDSRLGKNGRVYHSPFSCIVRHPWLNLLQDSMPGMRNPLRIRQGISHEHPSEKHDDESPVKASPVRPAGGAVVEPAYPGADTSDVDPNRVLLKMDLHLIPMLALLYLLSFLDRGNIGNAKIEGLVEDLNMTGPQYNWTCKVPSGKLNL
ncbi:MAG: hypothetical protein LQ350_007964 [Teloschistes chrysophthalmus]|nr:MAG: hypothetical protein LQ350_007964 [Niorma chrysophthalma]